MIFLIVDLIYELGRIILENRDDIYGFTVTIDVIQV